MRRLTAVVTVFAALGLGASSAQAAPPTAYEQGQKLCDRQAGVFIPGFAGYTCDAVVADFTTRELNQAQRLCVRNGGVEFVGSDPGYYTCYFPVI